MDTAYFVNKPELAWNALFKHIDRLIPLITDPEMYRMSQPNIVGGICHARVRYARKNNKLICLLYDQRQPTSYIMEMDANNFYGCAMLQDMSDSDFKWLSQNKCRDMELLLNYGDGRIAIFDTGILNYRENNPDKKILILKVELKYLPEQHERDDDYLLAPEVMKIEPNIAGEKQHNMRAQYFGAARPFSRKLICSFLLKTHYVVLGKLLRLYLERKMRLMQLHRAVRFKSSPYVASYIENNTAKRQQFMHNDLKKSFYKHIYNAPYGKTFENVARQTDIRLLNDIKKARR